MTPSPSIWRREVLGWSLYDFANTIYSMNITSRYLKPYIVEDLGYKDHYFDVPFSISMAIAALLLPALGAVSDHSAKKKTFLFLFTVVCCFSVGLMAYVPPTVILIISTLFILSNFSYEAGQPFYNALLYSVADGSRARFVSGIGVAFGYVGAIIGMILVQPFVTGGLFGLDIPILSAGGKTASFVPTAIIFMLFAVPLFLWVRELPVTKPGRIGLRQAYRDVWDGLCDARRYPGVRRFLIADYFIEDAVATVIINIGLYCSIVLSLEQQQIDVFLIISTISAVIGSFVIGKIIQRWSLKYMLAAIVWGWVFALLLSLFATSAWLIWVLGSLVGILLGGLWTTSRPLLAELVPRQDLGRFFGLFSLSGRAAAVVGPLVWTVVVYLFSAERRLGRIVIGIVGAETIDEAKLPYKMGILSLAVMMMVGLYIFRKVPHTRGHLHGSQNR